MLWIGFPPVSSVEGDEVVTDLELLTRGDDVNLPTYAIDNQPMTDLLAPLGYRFESESLEILPDERVFTVIVLPLAFALVKRFTGFHLFPFHECAKARWTA